MSSFSKFLKKFVPEYKAIAEALATLAIGVALDKPERKTVQDAIDKVQAATVSIEKGLAAVEKADAAGIDKATIKAAIKDILPGIIADTVDKAVKEAVAKALEDLTKPPGQ